MYYQQARNPDAERKASDVRLRAERRAGELLKELARASTPNPTGKNGHEVMSHDATQPRSDYARALDQNNITRQSASRYQALAEVPDDIFEAALRDPVIKPSTRRMIQEARDPVPQIPTDCLWIRALRRAESLRYRFEPYGGRVYQP